jgi:protein-S-isoprenylcysteine O-methyltransferase Ste14
MTRYERLFGAGPRGLLISAILFGLAWYADTLGGVPRITASDTLRHTALIVSIIGALLIATSSFRVMTPAERGHELVTSGAYRYARHPLYASLISCFNFGLAVFLNSWIYVLWAVLLHPVWHWNIKSEEELMREAFPDEYEAYCETTGRFFPRPRGK